MKLSRRDFMITGTSAAALLHTSANPIMAMANENLQKPSIGIQLYCVRGEFDKDVPGTIKKLAQIGYQGVEFYGYGGTPNVFKDWSAEKLRGLLDENKIKCCGIHMSVEALQEDRIETTLKNNKILGNHYLIVAAANNLMESPESIKKFAQLLNDSAKKAQKWNMQVGYHCHGFDFNELGGSTGWNLLFSQVAPEVVMQLDMGNCVEGGGDPIAILKKFPGRAATAHIKDWEKAPLTPNDPTWKTIMQLCKETQNTRWYIIEQGEASGLGFEVAKESYDTLKKMI